MAFPGLSFSTGRKYVPEELGPLICAIKDIDWRKCIGRIYAVSQQLTSVASEKAVLYEHLRVL
jgi:hypothetical protein